jgi:hypothetical protein
MAAVRRAALASCAPRSTRLTLRYDAVIASSLIREMTVTQM